MLRACMIDGFGWFADGDFRRAFLLFDQVEYLFPSKVKGPLWYRPSTFESGEYLARHEALGLAAPQLEESVARDLANQAFHAEVARVPKADRDYARSVVDTDPEVAWLLGCFPDQGEAVALSVLSSKLLLLAARSGTIPIVGRDYAWSMLMLKLRLEPANSPVALSAQALATPAQQVLCSVLGVGLALAYLDADALVATPFEALAKFKEKNARLLERHQLSLLDAAQRFASLPGDADLTARIGELRTEARRQQIEIEAHAEEAWIAAGLRLGRKAVVATASGALPLVAFLRNATLTDLLVAAIPGAGLALAAALGAADKGRRAREKPSAYLFQAQELANRHWGAAASRP